MTENEKARNKYDVNIEGKIYPWGEDHITVEQIRELGGLPKDQPVLEVNLDTNEEKTLPGDKVIKLEPGISFSRKVEFKRGI